MKNSTILFALLFGLSQIDSFAQTNQIANIGNIGVGTTTPKEQFQIGDLWTFHNGGSKFIGYNCYYDGKLRKLKAGYSSQLSFDGNGDIFIKTAGNGNANAEFSFNTGIVLKNDGKVGIGSEFPTERMDIGGNARVRGNILSEGAEFKLGLADGRFQGTKLENRALVHSTLIPQLKNMDGLIINYNGDFENGVLIDGPGLIVGGNVGMQDVEIQKKLVVGGISLVDSDAKVGDYSIYAGKGILTEKIRVAKRGSIDWADYVFEKDYRLMPLKELEAYIQTNKHLPNIPSSQEVADHGIDLAQINARLLEKVEELTLHLIEQQKQIDALKKQNEEFLIKFNSSKN